MEGVNDDPRIQLIGKVIDLLKNDHSPLVDAMRRSDQWVSDLFEDAELLLKKSEDHLGRRVHAYQLFKENGPLMSAREIESRFKEVGWKGKVSGHVKIRERNRMLLRKVESEVNRRLSLLQYYHQKKLSLWDAGEAMSVRLKRGVSELVNGLSIEELVADVELFKEGIVRHVEEMLDGRLREGCEKYIVEDPPAMFAVSRFMDFVCNSPTLDGFIVGGEAERVRPYELYLFASQEGIDEEFWTSTLDRIMDVDLVPRYKGFLSILETYAAGGDGA